MLSIQYEYMNGCDLLITTPGCFRRFISCQPIVFDKTRLKHLVIDGLDWMIQNSQDNIQFLLRKCCEKNPDKNPQIVVTSNIWLPFMENIRALSPNSLVCIANYIEAAVFAKCSFLLKKVQTTEEKLVQ